jgi:hypothetical protein
MRLMEKIIKRRNPNPFQTLTREDLVRHLRSPRIKKTNWRVNWEARKRHCWY